MRKLLILVILIAGFAVKFLEKDTPFRLDGVTVIDLHLDGIALSSPQESKAFFDINSDGTREKMGWVIDNNGIIAIDNNGNGIVDNGSELFGMASAEEKAQYDQNQDGFIDEDDAIFSKLKVWIDAGDDGICLASEVYPIKDYINKISIKKAVDINRSLQGNMVKQEGVCMGPDLKGQITAPLVTVEFGIDKNQAIPKKYADYEKFKKSPFIFMKIFELKPLIEAIYEDETLFKMLDDMRNISVEHYAEIDNKIEEFIYRWTKSYEKTSVNEKRLAAINAAFSKEIDPQRLDQYWDFIFTRIKLKIVPEIIFADNVFAGVEFQDIKGEAVPKADISYDELLNRTRNFYNKIPQQYKTSNEPIKSIGQITEALFAKDDATAMKIAEDFIMIKMPINSPHAVIY